MAKEKFKLLIVIVPFSQQREIEGYLRSKNIRGINSIRATGTAKSDVLDILGISDTEKYLMMCLVKSVNCQEVLQDLTPHLSHHGTGIALTIDIQAYAGLKTIFNFKGAKK